MDAKTRQQALNDISAEDLDKIQDHQAKLDNSVPVDNEWMLLGEFAKAYGWDAYQAAKNDEISTAEMATLIEVNRKLEFMDMYRQSQSSFVAVASANSKKPAKTFRELTKDLIKRFKIK